METVLVTKSNFEVIQKDLKAIKEHLKNVTSPAEHFVNNEDLLDLMGVSSRTAQLWRDAGEIGFSQKGKKIYYRMSDIEQFLLDYHHHPFAKKKKK